MLSSIRCSISKDVSLGKGKKDLVGVAIFSTRKSISTTCTVKTREKEFPPEMHSLLPHWDKWFSEM